MVAESARTSAYSYLNSGRRRCAGGRQAILFPGGSSVCGLLFTRAMQRALAN
ncbi:hypothetical protein [Micromonospora tarensis]|uniref:Uncharacterized protein n=1 Tax=Micromonospora tarensis TaxID=2806100 RepID=A0ABS1YIU3_9ACTN|nr:hypothetical protein [Micromonospora tarensis]MBM0277109.1 hypothetical protein [Micromonospora tarensis]